jgi:hypothetical protein
MATRNEVLAEERAAARALTFPFRHDLRRRDALLAKLVADYQPQTTLEHSSCEMLAGILEQLEVLKPGGPDHQRLVQLSQLLGESLEASRASRSPTTTNLEDLSPDALVAKAEKTLHMAKLLRDSKRAIDAPAATPSYSPTESEGPEPEAVASAPEPICQYCHLPLARCEQIKATRLDNWRALHYSDPEEVERREKAATDEMFESLRRFGPYRY